MSALNLVPFGSGADNAYDADGTSWAYTYDDANRLTSATESNAAGKPVFRVTYAYDVFGNRIERDLWSADTATTAVQRHVYHGQQVWADLDGANQVTTRYLVGDGTDQLLARETVRGGVGWYLTDRLGSVRDIVDDSGKVVDHVDYDPFGTVTVETNPALGDRYKFTSREYDPATGLYYNRARYYDPATGTFTTRDPMALDAGDLNLYRYAGNDPTNLTDPTGEWGLLRWIYTGDGNASEEMYAAASNAAGESFLGNSDKAKTALNVISVVDPTPISDGLGAGISYAQGKDQEALQELAMAAVPGALDKLGKAKAVGKLLGKTDHVADAGKVAGSAAALSKADDAAAAQQRLARANDALAQFKIKCFAAGTPLLTPDGEKCIEELRVGDLVLSAPEDDPAATPSFQRVEELFANSKPVMEVQVRGRVIRTTGEHPFWVRDRGWVKAEGLRVGDHFRGHDGCWSVVESLSGGLEFVPVYNVRVADYHTYFVGHRTWGFSVWAHNSEECSEAAEGIAGKAAAPNTTTLPDSYWQGKEAPRQITPGTRRVYETKASSEQPGISYDRTLHYDEYGRLTGRTEYTTHGRPDAHPVPHHHRRTPDWPNRSNAPEWQVNPDTGTVVFPGEFNDGLGFLH